MYNFLLKLQLRELGYTYTRYSLRYIVPHYAMLCDIPLNITMLYFMTLYCNILYYISFKVGEDKSTEYKTTVPSLDLLNFFIQKKVRSIMFFPW